MASVSIFTHLTLIDRNRPFWPVCFVFSISNHVMVRHASTYTCICMHNLWKNVNWIGETKHTSWKVYFFLAFYRCEHKTNYYKLFLISLGTAVIARRNEKKNYAKFWEAKKCIMGDVQVAYRGNLPAPMKGRRIGKLRETYSPVVE